MSKFNHVASFIFFNPCRKHNIPILTITYYYKTITDQSKPATVSIILFTESKG